MKDFDIQMDLNGVKNEIDNQSSRFEGGANNDETGNKKNWIEELNKLTQQVKNLAGTKTPEQLKAEKEKELAEKGTKFKVLGMNPFVAIGLSLGLIFVGSYFVVKIKAN